MRWIRFYLILLAATLFFSETEAQLFKKKNDKKGEKKEISSDDLLKAEEYFVEGQKHMILEDYTKALGFFQKSLQINDNNPTVYYKIAELLTKNGDLDNAAVYIEKALSLKDDNKYFYLLAAEIYSSQNNFKQTAEIYEKLVQKIPEATEAFFDLANVYIYTNEYAKAIDAYNKIEQKYGLNEQVSIQKQKLHLQLGELDKAVQEAKRLIDNFPGEEKYYVNLAEILISNEKPDQAKPFLEEYIEQYGGSPKIHLMMYEIYRKKDDFQQARYHLNESFSSPELDIEAKLQIIAGYISKLPDPDVENMVQTLAESLIETHPENPDAYAINGDLKINLGKKQEAIDYYRKAIELGETDNFALWQQILGIQMEAGNYDNVVSTADEAMEYFPNQAILYFFSGTANMILENYEDAIEMLEVSKQFSASNKRLLSDIHSQLGDAYHYAEEFDKSNSSYEEALKINPLNYHVLNNYSYFLSLRKENLNDAKKMSERLVEDNPDDPTFLDTHAWVLYNLEEYKEALKYIEKAVKGENTSGTILEHYGDILFKLGKVDEAVIQWEKAKGHEDSSDQIDKKIAHRKIYE